MSTQAIPVITMPKPKREKKARERGSGGLWLRGKVWYFSYYEDGVQRIESSHTTKRRDAKDMLADRLSGLRRGEVADVRKLRYEDIRKLAIHRYSDNGTL